MRNKVIPGIAVGNFLYMDVEEASLKPKKDRPNVFS